MPFGWSDEPLYAEQKLENLFHTIDNALNALQKAYRLDNPLKRSTLDRLEFQAAHGYRAVMQYTPGEMHPAIDRTRRQGFPTGNAGYWMIYAERIGSLGDDRHKWPVWDGHMARYEAPPKGLLLRELPRDYLGESFGDLNPLHVTEDHLIAATIEKNKWRPGRIPPLEFWRLQSKDQPGKD